MKTLNLKYVPINTMYNANKESYCLLHSTKMKEIFFLWKAMNLQQGVSAL